MIILLLLWCCVNPKSFASFRIKIHQQGFSDSTVFPGKWIFLQKLLIENLKPKYYS